MIARPPCLNISVDGVLVFAFPLRSSLLTQHLVQLLSQFNRVPLSLCGKGFCVVWTKTNTPSPVMLRHGGHVIIGTVQGLGWTPLTTRGV